MVTCAEDTNEDGRDGRHAAAEGKTSCSLLNHIDGGLCGLCGRVGQSRVDGSTLSCQRYILLSKTNIFMSIKQTFSCQ